VNELKEKIQELENSIYKSPAKKSMQFWSKPEKVKTKGEMVKAICRLEEEKESLSAKLLRLENASKHQGPRSQL
jgi:hypothetical protein